MRLFVDVVRNGSFAAAADAQSVAPSSVSRSIAALERELGVRLFERTTRRLSLTEAGAAYYDRIKPLLHELEAAQLVANDLQLKPKGLLRITSSHAFGQLVLAPAISAFRLEYPEIHFDLVLSDQVLDLAGDRTDLGIRHGRLDDASFVCRKLQSVRYILAASPEYLERAGTPRSPGDLSEHELISYDFEPFRSGWRLSRAGKTETLTLTPKIVSGSVSVIRSLAESGAGVALLANWLASDLISSGRLVRVLAEWEGTDTSPDPSIWIVYPSRSYLPAKTRLFVDFLLGKNASPSLLDQPAT
ncbi:MAG: LysR family transcriptional regulator [Pseudomonadota bacterium]|nr:LysR family transcriptional regulator [Pseudomonadota bacterium]